MSKRTRGRGWLARYAAAYYWAPPEGVISVAYCNVFTGRVWVRLACSEAEETVVINSEDEYEVGSTLDSVAMEMLMNADEPMVAVLARAGRTFERGMERIGGNP